MNTTLFSTILLFIEQYPRNKIVFYEERLLDITPIDVGKLLLLNSAFSFSFEVLRTFGKFFAVQDMVNTQTIKKPIADVYGGNRATENALYTVVPMFIEAGFFSRPKTGIYQSAEPMKISSPLTVEIYKESFKLNNAYNSLNEYQLRDPYFLFLGDSM